MGDVQGKRKGDPAIERDRGIQTREDQLGYCEKRCIFFSLKYEIGGKILCSVLAFLCCSGLVLTRRMTLSRSDSFFINKCHSNSIFI
jgi:hypothetical protein